MTRKAAPWSIPRPGDTPAPLPTPEVRAAPIERLALSPEETAIALGVSLTTLRGWEAADTAPPSIVMPGGRRRLYPIHLLRAWLAERARAGTYDQGDSTHGTT